MGEWDLLDDAIRKHDENKINLLNRCADKTLF